MKNPNWKWVCRGKWVHKTKRAWVLFQCFEIWRAVYSIKPGIDCESYQTSKVKAFAWLEEKLGAIKDW